MNGAGTRLLAVCFAVVLECAAQSVAQAHEGVEAMEARTRNVNSLEQVRYVDQFNWSQTPDETISAPGARTAITLGTNNVATGIATLTFAVNPFQAGEWIIVTGMRPASYNGTWRVLKASGTQVTFQQYDFSLGPGTAFGTAVRNDQTVKIRAVRGISGFSASPGDGRNHDYVIHSLYISGEGSAEVVPITATTCKGASTGTCTITVAAGNGHGAGYSIGSATAGAQEAINDCAAALPADTNPIMGCKVAWNPFPSAGHYLMRGTLCVQNRHGSSGDLILDGNGATLEDAVLGRPMIQVNCQAPYNGASSNVAQNVVMENFAFAPSAGLGRAATGLQNFLTDTSQEVTLRSISFGGFIDSDDVVDYAVRVSGDQQFALYDSTFNNNPMKCDATFCGAGIYGDALNGAAVGVIRNTLMNMFCHGNAINWTSGNGLTLADDVFENWSQYPWRYGGGSGLIDVTDGGGNYYEGGRCVNPDFGVPGFSMPAGPQIGSNHAYLAPLTSKGSVQPFVFSDKGTKLYNYFVVGINGAGQQTRALFIGQARSDGVTTYKVRWHSFGAKSYDLLRAGPLRGEGNDAAPYGPGNWAVQTGAACPPNPCTFTENFQAPAKYTVHVFYGQWAPTFDQIAYWPVSVALLTPGMVYVGPATTLVTTSNQSAGSYYDGVFTSPGYGMGNTVPVTGARIKNAINVQFAGGNATNPGATIAPPVNHGATSTLKKGLINFPTLSYNQTNSCYFQVYDSDPSKTLMTAGHQPALDANDACIGVDSGKDRMAIQGGANPIDVYVGHIMDSGTSAVAQFTASGMTARKIGSSANCAANSGSPAACGSAASGAFVVPRAVTTYTVNTTAVTAGSRIFLTPMSFAGNLPGSPACAVPVNSPGTVSGIIAGTSFTVVLSAQAGPTCWQYWVVD